MVGLKDDIVLDPLETSAAAAEEETSTSAELDVEAADSEMVESDAAPSDGVTENPSESFDEGSSVAGSVIIDGCALCDDCEANLEALALAVPRWDECFDTIYGGILSCVLLLIVIFFSTVIRGRHK